MTIDQENEKKKDKLTIVRQLYQLIPSRNTDDQRILNAKNQVYQLILSRDLDDRRNLQFDWISGLTDHTQRTDHTSKNLLNTNFVPNLQVERVYC